jgi:hypothetical protein
VARDVAAEARLAAAPEGSLQAVLLRLGREVMRREDR